MIIRVIAILAAAFLVTGCGKKVEPSSTTTPTATQPAPSAQNIKYAETNQMQVYTPTAAPVVAAATNAAPDLSELNRYLIQWIIKNRRPPASFEDFAATAGVTIPPAPAGKKYVIAKNMHILLVDR
jgi:hypothetical protein